MSHGKLALSFRMFQNGQLVREETLTQSVIKIGKVPSAHLQIADEAVSRMHAIVEVTGREVSLIDLGSTRGTFVNGKKIHKARLEAGDVILLGDTRLELGIGEAARRTDAAVVGGVAGGVAGAVAGAGSVTVSGLIESTHALPPSVPAAVAPARVGRAPHPARTPMPDGIPAVPAPSPPALPVDPVARTTAFPRAVAESADELGGARSVEVAAMLGDSVVGVKHCIDPRSGKVTPATWGLIAGGAACLLASAIAFTTSVHHAAEDRARFETWTRIEHRPAYAFRPHMLGPGVDWIAFGGFGLALAGLALGVVRMRSERTSPYYRIGTAPGVELAMGGAPAPAFPLVAPSGDDFVFNFAPGIDGELLLDGKATPLAELAAAGRARPNAALADGAVEVPIPPKARIRARAGRTTFMISAVARPRRRMLPLVARLERRALLYFAGSLAAHLGIWALLQLLPPEAAGVSIEIGSSESIYVGNRSSITNDPVPPPATDPGGSGGQPGSAPMSLPSGTPGTPDRPDPGHRTVAASDRPPALSRDAEIEIARNAGFLGALSSSAFSALSGPPDPASGFDDESSSGALFDGHGGGGGSFGTGRTGFDVGGCAVGTCGLLRGGPGYQIGTIGHGDGPYRLHPTGGFGLPAPRPDTPAMSGAKISGSGYDKSIVRRYIRRSLDKITYCYDKQLLVRPGIGGEIMATFFITPTGAVQTASGTGFDRDVAACVADVIKTIAFPRTGDGAGVQVNYPFQFHAAGR
ncbi:MAG TPA: AgmX/PglI C-terminal domain-containing protein [Kofleriaceae bacterium]